MTTVMERVREHVEAVPVGRYVHTRDVIAEQLGGRAAVDVALHRMKEDGDLRPVRRGVYYKGRRTRFGITAPDPIDAAMEVAHSAGYDGGVGPAGYTAARMLGLTTQVPAVGEVSVPGRPPADLPQVKFVSRSPRARRRLRPIEVAVLELLSSWPRYSEESWGTFIQRVRELAGVGELDVTAVRAAADGERHVKTRELADRLAGDLIDKAATS